MKLILIFCFFIPLGMSAEKIKYKYKKYQEFDLETLGVMGGKGAPLDLSSKSRIQLKFKNKLPFRKNFNPEIKRSTEVVR